jgi:hypothetical protein
VDPAILIIIVFIVAPLIERLLKAGKQNQQQQNQQQQQQRMPPRPRPRLPREELPEQWGQEEDGQPESRPVLHRAETRDDAAAEMLPDDLWEILTGERRPPQRPSPQRLPEEVTPIEETLSLEAESLEEEGSLEVQPSGRWMSTPPEQFEVTLPPEPYIRPNPLRPAPKVVSREELTFDPEQRHDEFHDRLDGLGGPARVKRPAPSTYRFRNDEDLRRAIVTAEILGTPRGLE